MSFSKKIFNEKLHFRENALPKVNSLENIEHQPKTSDKQIHREILPWLRYNRPNLPEHIKEQINQKRYSFELYPPNSPENEIPLQERKSQDSKSLPKIESNRHSADKDDNVVAIETKTKSTKESGSKKHPIKEKERDSTPKSMISSNKKVSTTKTKRNETVQPPQKIDAATETDPPNLVTVAAQTMLKTEALKTTKLKNALKNSNTFENNYMLRHNGDTGYGAHKVDRRVKERTEEIITSRVIETFLPSISTSEKENKDKSSKSYSYYNYRKNVNNKPTNNLPPANHLVTHAGVSFLDQYWASQRWLMLNRENNDFNECPETGREIPVIVGMRSPKYSDLKEKQTFRDLFNGRKQHYSESDEQNSHQQSQDIDIITSKDLNKLVT